MSDFENVLLGLDIGYTGCKAVAFNCGGQILRSAYREYSINYPRPGWAEMDPNLIWDKACSAIREVTSSLPVPIKAMSVSVMGEAFTPVDRHGQPVMPTITGFDGRGKTECEYLIERLGAQKIFEITGQVPGPSYPLPKICWLKQNRPETFKSVDKFLCFGDFVLKQLGLTPTIDYSMAARSMAFNVHEKQWSKQILDLANIDPSLLPEVVPSGTVLGTPDSKVAKQLGLSKSTVIVIGGHDTPCGALGAAIITPGQATYTLGTVHSICAVVDRFYSSLGIAGFPCYPHVIPNRYVTIGYNFTGGSLLRWYRDTFAQEEIVKAKTTNQDPYELILADIGLKPSDLFVIPHFSGTGTPWFDTNAKGSILGLTLNTKKSEIVKAILEGTTFELAMNVKLLEKAGVPITELHAIGGSAKSDKDIQIRTNIMRRPVHIMNVTEAPALGAAILAGVGIGIYKSAEVASRQIVEVGKVLCPEPEIAQLYKNKLKTYEIIHPLLRNIYAQTHPIKLKHGTIKISSVAATKKGEKKESMRTLNELTPTSKSST